jgi:hypothetical protein
MMLMLDALENAFSKGVNSDFYVYLYDNILKGSGKYYC